MAILVLTDLQHPVHARRLQELEPFVERQVALFGVLRRRTSLRHAYQRRVHEYVTFIARKRPVDNLLLHRFRYAIVPFLDSLERYVFGHYPGGDVQQRIGRPERRRSTGRRRRRTIRATVSAAWSLVGYAGDATAARPFARRHRYDDGDATTLLLSLLFLVLLLRLRRRFGGHASHVRIHSGQDDGCVGG